jgi:RNA polymerase sigma-70 factor (ECF subfamily)
VPDHETRPDDPTLVRRARGGDHDAYAQLVRRYQAIALRVASVAGPSADAEDAVQEAFVKAHRALARYDERRPFRPWLLAIVGNEARNRGRSAQRASALVDRAAAHAAAEDTTASAEESALQRIGAGPLAAAVGTLRPDEQELLTYRFVLDLSEEETAAALGVRRGTVKSRTSRALARLRSVLPEEPA